ncbi:Kelch-like protein 20 [Geodia barretti]|uniref:Kelch-like protein 20 n=1 Tax=Geodia barretti TaxID=519541 RepID=A0AA35T2W9_GEOBA|nr:Kelch-like protein 20 [Geodia barretti]
MPLEGKNDTPEVSKVEEYDTERDAWTEKKSMPTGRFRLATAAVGGKIYVMGGTPNNFQALATVEEYDTKTDSWTKKADMPTARMGLAAVVVGGKIYAIGGAADFFFPTGAVEVYNSATDSWEQKPDMANPRWNLAAAAVLSKIYVFGGAVDISHQKATDLVEEYDTKTDTWIPKAKMRRDFHGHGAAFVNSGKIYTIGGQKWKGKGGFQNLAEGPTDWTMYRQWLNMTPRKTDGKSRKICQLHGRL